MAVLAVPHPVDDEHPIAFVTKVPDAKVHSCCNYNKIVRDSIKLQFNNSELRELGNYLINFFKTIFIRIFNKLLHAHTIFNKILSKFPFFSLFF